MRHIDRQTFLSMADELCRPFHKNYLAMYSSVYGGLITDPVLMMIPLDDHMAHRGDAVFEAFKCVHGNIYNMKVHLERLAKSAAALSLVLPESSARIGEIVVETIRAGGVRDCMIRLYVSRGPGGFGLDPYECPKSQLYVVITRLPPPFMDIHPDGARVGISSYPVKPPFLAEAKNCNYLPNVMMQKEAVDMGCHFVVALHESGCIAECSSENIGIVTGGCELLFPRMEGILSGTTMLRVMDLAGELVETGDLKSVGFSDIPVSAVREALEVLIVGTTRDVARVCQFDGQPVNEGKPAPICRKLNELLKRDIVENRAILTPAF